MVWRAFRAFSVFKSKTNLWQLRFLDHVGFNVISLFAGFVIVLAIVLGVPIWLVVVIGVVSIVGGIFGVHRVKEKEKTLKQKPDK